MKWLIKYHKHVGFCDFFLSRKECLCCGGDGDGAVRAVCHDVLESEIKFMPCGCLGVKEQAADIVILPSCQ
jgi:hypothetical protein